MIKNEREFEGEDCLPSSPFKAVGKICSLGHYELLTIANVSIFQTKIPKRVR